MSKTAMQALFDRSMELGMTVTAHYSQHLVSLVADDEQTRGVSHEPDATYFWGYHKFDDPHHIWMVKLLLPGEA